MISAQLMVWLALVASSATTGVACAQSDAQMEQINSTAATNSTTGAVRLFPMNEAENRAEYWLRHGRLSLEAAAKSPYLENYRAKNGILFIGDGMGLSTITAARILNGQFMNRSGEEAQLSFERLPRVSLLKTYNLDQQVPDSGATATAILCGAKANFYTIGVTGSVKLSEQNCDRVEANKLSSILELARLAGKSIGIVTNTRVTHATPAAAYAHTSNRRFEFDNSTAATSAFSARSGETGASASASASARSPPPGCKDIALQLVEDEPGASFNVILGGGRRAFFGPHIRDPGAGGQPGLRADGRNLIEEWIARRKSRGQLNYAFVNSSADLRAVDADRTDFLLGLFSYTHMKYEELRDSAPSGEPSLQEMTEVALKVLQKNPNGFLLLVEGGRIDHAHHENIAAVALRETIALSWAVDSAMSWAAREANSKDTILAVTADHGHTMTINGLAPRGNPILGLSKFKEASSGLPYTTLLYGNGPGHKAPRQDPSLGPNSSTPDQYQMQYAAVHQEEAFHDGTDVPIFASGPYAHLFQGVQEQTLVAHVFSYSLCLGQFAEEPHCRRTSKSNFGQSSNLNSNLNSNSNLNEELRHKSRINGWQLKSAASQPSSVGLVWISAPLLMFVLCCCGYSNNMIDRHSSRHKNLLVR